jgi:hypothetical protein
VTLRRVHFTCRRCGANAHLLDDRLGVDGRVSPHAQRPLALAGAERSFERAARLLRELSGLDVCDDTVRAACDRYGWRMRGWQREDPEVNPPFRGATGDVEFQTDGTCVNTAGGWREMRLSIFAKRPCGEPVTDLDAWDDRWLPAPTARVAAVGIRTGVALGPQWRRAAAQLGIKDARAITVIADGAKWIWAQVERNLTGVAEVLNIYHANEQIRTAAIALHSEPAASRAWAEGRRRTLLESGVAGLLAELGAAGGTAVELAAYLTPHADHTDYRRRLVEGRPIGIWLMEGACKTVVGRRLKQTGARWRVRQVERMTSLCWRAPNGMPTGRRPSGEDTVPLPHPCRIRGLYSPSCCGPPRPSPGPSPRHGTGPGSAADGRRSTSPPPPSAPAATASIGSGRDRITRPVHSSRAVPAHRAPLDPRRRRNSSLNASARTALGLSSGSPDSLTVCLPVRPSGRCGGHHRDRSRTGSWPSRSGRFAPAARMSPRALPDRCLTRSRSSAWTA